VVLDRLVILPLGINHVIRGWPRATIALIVACTLIQIYGDAIAPSVHDVQAQILQRAAEVPFDADDATQERAAADIEEIANQLPSYRFGYRTDSGLSYRGVTSAFVHDGWLHLLGNMLFLWLAGAALEDRWGRTRFLAFYAAGAVVSALGFSLTHDGEVANLVGASGAVSALMGAFLVFFARTQIHFVYWIGLSAGRFDATAAVALPLWLAEQLLYAKFAGGSNVAFTAHIAGFVFGVVVAVIARLVGRERADAPAASERPPVAKVVASAPKPPKVAAEPSSSLPLVRPPPLAAPPLAAPPPVAVAAPARVEPPKQDPPADPESGPRFLT
jgi:membrane associated rhomboid family serine protease